MVSGQKIKRFGMAITKSGSKSDRESLAGVKSSSSAKSTQRLLTNWNSIVKMNGAKSQLRFVNLICNYKKRLLSVITTKGHAIDY